MIEARNGKTNRLYRIWQAMKSRCKEGHEKQHLYFDRGISVCGEWSDSYKHFMDWAVANGYTGELTIDRIDNDKGYYPDNCRWVTHLENSLHRRPSAVAAAGEALSIRRANEYEKNPKTCKKCGSPLSYENRDRIYCGPNCQGLIKNRIKHKENNIQVERASFYFDKEELRKMKLYALHARKSPMVFLNDLVKEHNARLQEDLVRHVTRLNTADMMTEELILLSESYQEKSTPNL